MRISANSVTIRLILTTLPSPVKGGALLLNERYGCGEAIIVRNRNVNQRRWRTQDPRLERRLAHWRNEYVVPRERIAIRFSDRLFGRPSASDPFGRRRCDQLVVTKDAPDEGVVFHRLCNACNGNDIDADAPYHG